MPSQNRFPVYDQRLRVIVAGVKSKPDTELTIAWKQDLDSHSLDDLVDRIAGMTLTQTKKVLSGDEPPTTSEMHQLRPVNGSSKPGTYFGLTEDSTGSNSDSPWTGSNLNAATTSKSSGSISTSSTTEPKVRRSHKVVESATEDEAAESEQSSDELPDIDLKTNFQTASIKTTSHGPTPARTARRSHKVIDDSSDDEGLEIVQTTSKTWTGLKLKTAKKPVSQDSSDSISTLSATKPKMSRSHKIVDSSAEDESSESARTSHSLSSKSIRLKSKATTQAQKGVKKKSPARKVVESSSDDEDGGSEQSSDDDDDDLKTSFQMPSVSTVWTASNSTGSNSSAFGYNGSATRVGRGLVSRTNQHLDEEYRKTYLEKKPNYYHYLLQKNGDRSETFFVLAETEWPSEKAEDITETRFLLVLAEQVYTIWLRTYTPKAADGPQKDLAALCPWPGKRFSWSGVNQSSPVRNDIARAAKDAEGLTPQEQNKRTADRARQKKENWTPEELGEAQVKRSGYHQLVALPVRKFKVRAKSACMPKSKVDAAVREFQKAIRLAKKTGEEDRVDSEEYLKVRK